MKGKRVRLTTRFCQAAKFVGTGDEWCAWMDEELVGFGLRAYPGGRKQFFARFRVGRGGARRYLALGDFGVMTCDEARELAREALASARKGTDPTAVPEAVLTVADLATVYLERHVAHLKRGDVARTAMLYILPALGTKAVTDLGREDVEALHASITKRGMRGAPAPVVANKTVIVLRGMLTKAREWGMVPESYRLPAEGMRKNREVARDRWLRGHELARLFAALDVETNPVGPTAILVLLLTGKRKNEVVQAQWRQVDLDAGVLRLDDTKSGRTEDAMLPTRAVDALRRLHELTYQGADSPVFPCGVSYPWERIRARAGLDDVTIHDLRRTLATYLTETDCDPFVLASILNHALPGVTARYARVSEPRKREALERANDRIWALGHPEEGAS